MKISKLQLEMMLKEIEAMEEANEVGELIYDKDFVESGYIPQYTIEEVLQFPLHIKEIRWLISRRKNNSDTKLIWHDISSLNMLIFPLAIFPPLNLDDGYSTYEALIELIRLTKINKISLTDLNDELYLTLVYDYFIIEEGKADETTT